MTKSKNTQLIAITVFFVGLFILYIAYFTPLWAMSIWIYTDTPLLYIFGGAMVAFGALQILRRRKN